MKLLHHTIHITINIIECITVIFNRWHYCVLIHWDEKKKIRYVYCSVISACAITGVFVGVLFASSVFLLSKLLREASRTRGSIIFTRLGQGSGDKKSTIWRFFGGSTMDPKVVPRSLILVGVVGLLVDWQEPVADSLSQVDLWWIGFGLCIRSMFVSIQIPTLVVVVDLRETCSLLQWLELYKHLSFALFWEASEGVLSFIGLKVLWLKTDHVKLVHRQSKY